ASLVVRREEGETWRRCHGHNIRHSIGQNVLEDPALRSLPAGGRPAGGCYTSGGGHYDTGATGGGQIHSTPSSWAGSVLPRCDRHPLCAQLPPGCVDLYQVPHLRQNSDGAIRPLVDCGFIRIQRACRDYGHGPPAGLLVFLAAAFVRG